MAIMNTSVILPMPRKKLPHKLF